MPGIDLFAAGDVFHGTLPHLNLSEPIFASFAPSAVRPAKITLRQGAVLG
jgi:hypothetical protein